MASKPSSAKIETIVALAKRRGFVFASGEIYGGTRSAWDYGPLGVELKENIKRQWWRAMVTGREDVVGLDSSVILPRQVWVASGPRRRVHRPAGGVPELPQALPRRPAGRGVRRAHRARRPPRTTCPRCPCPNCGTRGQYTAPREFNMMLKTHLGPVESEEGLHYLRPETAQGIFVNFLNVQTDLAQEAAVRHRADRQELPQRDHAGQLHLPHARVRADGDGVLRRARHRRGMAPVLDRRAHRTGTSTWASRGTTCATTSTPRRSSRTTRSAPWTSSTGSASPARSGASWRASPTAPTSTSRRTPTTPGVDLSFYDQATGTRYRPYVIEPAAGVGRSMMAFLLEAYAEDEAPNAKGGVDTPRRAAAGPPAGAGEGRGAAAVAQRRPLPEGPRPRRAAAQDTGTSTSTTPARSAAATAGRTRSARRSA